MNSKGLKSLLTCTSVFVGGSIVLLLIGIVSTWLKPFSSRQSGIPVRPDTTVTPGGDKPLVVRYDEPDNVYGTPVYIARLMFNISSLKSSSGSTPYAYRYSGQTVNLVFFNVVENTFHLLFDRPVEIITYDYPHSKETSKKKYVIYQVIMDDTNKDGFINTRDNDILFFSDLEGRGLTQITPDDLNVAFYEYMDDFRGLMITTSISVDIEGSKEKSWQNKIYWYDFESNTLSTSERLDELLKESNAILIAPGRRGGS